MGTLLTFIASAPGAIIRFLKSPVGKVVGTFILVFLLLLAVYHEGRKSGKADADAAHSAQQQAAKDRVKELGAQSEKITADVSSRHDKAVTEIRWRTRYLTKEVPIYVTAEDDANCVVPDGFVSLYNAAAEGGDPALPEPPGGPGQSDSGVPLSAVAETDLHNLGVGQYYRTEALTWREWYASQREAYRAATAPAR